MTNYDGIDGKITCRWNGLHLGRILTVQVQSKSILTLSSREQTECHFILYKFDSSKLENRIVISGNNEIKIKNDGSKEKILVVAAVYDGNVSIEINNDFKPEVLDVNGTKLNTLTSTEPVLIIFNNTQRVKFKATIKQAKTGTDSTLSLIHI